LVFNSFLLKAHETALLAIEFPAVRGFPPLLLPLITCVGIYGPKKLNRSRRARRLLNSEGGKYAEKFDSFSCHGFADFWKFGAGICSNQSFACSTAPTGTQRLGLLSAGG
jgi:hypothetical protein